MAENIDTPSLGGFMEISNILKNPASSGMDEDGISDLSNKPTLAHRTLEEDMTGADPIKIDGDAGTDPIVDPAIDTDDDTDPTDDDTSTTDDTGSADDSTTDDSDGTPDTSTNDDTDLSEYEEDISKLLKEKLEESLNWEIPDDYEIKTVEDVVNFMKDLTAEASKPKYASEDIRNLDEYVKNGGDLNKYFNAISSKKLDIASANLENEFDQKRIITEHLKTQGYKDEQIARRLERYDEAGVLEDEAKDALDMLTEYTEKEEQKLLEEQKNKAKLIEEQQQSFVNNVEDTIKSLSDVRGLPVTDKEKQELLDYILKVDSSGVTPYQKDYMSDIKHLVESAYFTKNGKTLIERSKQKGKTDAYRSLHQKLKTNKGNKGKNTTGRDYSDSSSSGLSQLGSSLLGNN